VLRTSYSCVMRQSKEQIRRLIIPKTIGRMFRNLGGVPNSVDVTQRICATQEIIDPYGKRNWTRLCSVIKFLGLVGKSMQQSTREYVVCMLLRMSIDRVILHNVNILDLVQEVLCRLCFAIPDDMWDSSVSYKSRFLLLS
jgi:hypothetical protein